MSETLAPRKKIDLRGVLQQGLPMVGYSTANIFKGGTPYIITLYFLTFLTEVEGLGFTQASLVVLLAKIWDAVIDPFMGLLTDRTRTKYGRRRPYFLFGIIPLALSYFSLWYSFGIPNEQTTAKMAYFIFAYMFFTTASSLISVPHESLLPETAPTYVLRINYNNVGYIFNSVGMLSSFALASALLGFTQTADFTPALKSKFLFMGAVQAVFFALPMFITFFSTKEKDWRSVPKPELNPREVFWEYTTTFKNRAFRQYLALVVTNVLAMNIWTAAHPFFVRYVGRVNDKFNLITTYQGFGQMCGFPLNWLLSLLVGKQAPARLLTPLMLVALGLSFLINPTLGDADPTRAFILQTAVAVLFYFGYSGMGMTPNTIFPDTSDVDELITGRRREGVLSAVNTFAQQSMQGLGQAIAGWIFAAFGVATSTGSGVTVHQDATGVWGLRFAFAILPALLVVISIVLSRRIKMKKSDLELIQRVIAEKKEHGIVTVTDEEREILESVSGQKYETLWVSRC